MSLAFESIKTHHQALIGDESAYTRGTRDIASLERYAAAAVEVGKGEWVRAGHEWMENQMINFFKRGGARSAYMKSRRKTSFNFSSTRGDLMGSNNMSLIPKGLVGRTKINSDVLSVPDDLIGPRKIKVLDVGSCYNPFAKCKSKESLDVVALDLMPAAQGVFQCDFLDLDTIPMGCDPVSDSISNDQTAKQLLRLPVNTYDVATISLVLSYLPSPSKRMQMLEKTWQLLRKPMNASNLYGGLLLIMEPYSITGSGDRGVEVLRLWRNTICRIGFEVVS